MKPRQTKAMQALFTEPTLEAAAKAAGISPRTLRDYMKDQEFKAAYNETVTAQLGETTGQARQGLSSALAVLREIMEDPAAENRDRISAASKSPARALMPPCGLLISWISRQVWMRCRRWLLRFKSPAGNDTKY